MTATTPPTVEKESDEATARGLRLARQVGVLYHRFDNVTTKPGCT